MGTLYLASMIQNYNSKAIVFFGEGVPKNNHYITSNGLLLILPSNM
jgi:hypothetical protein